MESNAGHPGCVPFRQEVSCFTAQRRGALSSLPVPDLGGPVATPGGDDVWVCWVESNACDGICVPSQGFLFRRVTTHLLSTKGVLNCGGTPCISRQVRQIQGALSVRLNSNPSAKRGEKVRTDKNGLTVCLLANSRQFGGILATSAWVTHLPDSNNSCRFLLDQQVCTTQRL